MTGHGTLGSTHKMYKLGNVFCGGGGGGGGRQKIGLREGAHFKLGKI